MFESDEYNDYGSQAYKVLRTLREYLNSKLRYESINNIEFRVGDIYEAQSGNAFAFEVDIQDPEIYTRESNIKIVSSNELYSRDIFLYKYGFDTNNYIEISRFGAGDKLLNIIKDIAESIPDYEGKDSVYATRESIVKPNRKRPITESKKDQVERMISILNDVYNLSDNTTWKLAISGAYGKVQLVLRNNDTGAERSMSGFVSMTQLYDIVDTAYNIHHWCS